MEKLDKLVLDPASTLSFDVNGKTVWGERALVTSPSEKMIQRNILEDLVCGMNTDEVLIEILKNNPGVELQVLASNGIFPYFALHKHGCEEIVLPDGVFIHNKAIYATKFIHLDSHDICLAEILN